MSYFYYYYVHVVHPGYVLVGVHQGVLDVLEVIKNAFIQFALQN